MQDWLSYIRAKLRLWAHKTSLQLQIACIIRERDGRIKDEVFLRDLLKMRAVRVGKQRDRRT